LTAPFDGVITYRNPDIGTLVSAGASQKEVFRVSDISKIRIFVNVPQAYVSAVRPGTPTVVHVEDINKDYHLKVGGIANALDLNSRTMLAVIRVPNIDGPLMPGMFCRVKLLYAESPFSIDDSRRCSRVPQRRPDGRDRRRRQARPLPKSYGRPRYRLERRSDCGSEPWRSSSPESNR